MKNNQDNNKLDRWSNNPVQFARLIAEIEAAGGFTKSLMHDLCESMDLTIPEISNIVDRAQADWDRIKESEDDDPGPYITVWATGKVHSTYSDEEPDPENLGTLAEIYAENHDLDDGVLVFVKRRGDFPEKFRVVTRVDYLVQRVTEEDD